MGNMHQKYMSRCIQLAKNGLGTTYPNPLVGSVIVHENRIIGEGWHYQAGEPHAEVNAIRSVTDESILKNATMYVSLEPCSHHGKTPPCSDLIIEKGIRKVVIGTVDPFAKVSGSGIQKLMNAGCDVIVGILEKECQELNKRFFTFHTQKRPYIILKWAETMDGFIAPGSRYNREPVWITNIYSRQLTHRWRAEEQGILVGSKTVINDNPKLTIRNQAGNNPIRIVINRSHEIPENSYVLDQVAKTIMITSEDTRKKDHSNLIYEMIDSENHIVSEICRILYKQDIQSVIVEGGARTLQGFIDQNYWDEARIFTGNTSFGSGVKAPVFNKKHFLERKNMDDTLRFYKND